MNIFVEAIKKANPHSETNKFRFDLESYNQTATILKDWDFVLSSTFDNPIKKTLIEKLGFGNYKERVKKIQQERLAEEQLYHEYANAFSKITPNKFIKKELAVLFV